MLKNYAIKHIGTIFALVFHGNSFYGYEYSGVVRQLHILAKTKCFKVYVNGIRRLIS